jgi:hypothetical protein
MSTIAFEKELQAGKASSLRISAVQSHFCPKAWRLCPSQKAASPVPARRTFGRIL